MGAAGSANAREHTARRERIDLHVATGFIAAVRVGRPESVKKSFSVGYVPSLETAHFILINVSEKW